jgi:hypothetical protein
LINIAAGSWLTRSFNEYTLAWLLLSSVVGGVVGASVKFLFDDVLSPRLGSRRETARTIRKYTTPLVRSAEALERRINIMVRNDDERWYQTDEYFRLSTLYLFGDYFSWIRILERTFGFLPYESHSRGRQLNFRLNGPFRALTSHAYFRGYVDMASVGASGVPRLMLSAIGEGMTSAGNVPVTFTEFLGKYADDTRFRRWFADLDSFLSEAHRNNGVYWDRLIAAGATLRMLIQLLEPRGDLVAYRDPANLELLVHPEVRVSLENEARKYRRLSRR